MLLYELKIVCDEAILYNEVYLFGWREFNKYIQVFIIYLLILF